MFLLIISPIVSFVVGVIVGNIIITAAANAANAEYSRIQKRNEDISRNR